MTIEQDFPLSRLPTPETAADDVAAVALYFLRHRNGALRKSRTEPAWLVIAAEIVMHISDIPYTRVEMQADLVDPENNRRLNAKIPLIEVNGMVLRVDTNSMLRSIERKPFMEALADMKSGPIFKPEDEDLINVSVSIEDKRMLESDYPAWMPALISSLKMKFNTPDPGSLKPDRSAPRF